ncbi:SH3 domain-containing protein [Listeria floridensis FSL S10-1187]|uniref:SH3 domain-containing protein n=1 Tax=Listeria floridensis FSL S10-1187 TaxID=1265817 RepID=A0ABN0RDK9_9LIST|nr:hypothetical protein [Listeria floridensis]EUJ28860.1 SH3 domain-containing protein [Listeria floridensis FSL S10-1187]
MNKSYIVTKAHHPSIKHPLFLNMNEGIWILQEDNAYPGWVLVKAKSSGTEGYAPKQIIAYGENENSGTVTEDYSARELDVNVNDKLESNRELNGWAWCVTEEKRAGWVPLENLEEA